MAGKQSIAAEYKITFITVNLHPVKFHLAVILDDDCMILWMGCDIMLLNMLFFCIVFFPN